jgi:aquaporin Z
VTSYVAGSTRATRQTLHGVIACHLPEYLIEATGVAVIMLALAGSAILLIHPESPLMYQFESLPLRRLLMGLAMACVGIALVYSPWGKQSGAHFNPAVTLAFYHLRRVHWADALLYALSQFLGGVLAVLFVRSSFEHWLEHPAIHQITSMPAAWNTGITCAVEFVASFILMSVILTASNSRRYAKWTGLFVALLVVVNVSVLIPLFGTSLNPARTLAAAVPAGIWTSIWIYLTAAPAGMLLAAEWYIRSYGKSAVFCAKLHHQNDKRCIFCQSRAEIIELDRKEL